MIRVKTMTLTLGLGSKISEYQGKSNLTETDDLLNLVNTIALTLRVDDLLYVPRKTGPNRSNFRDAEGDEM